MTLTQNITLDVARETALHIAGKQFDENSRFLLVTIKEAGEEKSIPAGSTITLNARRPDGSAQSFAGSIQDGKALVEIDQWILEQYGTVYCSVSVVDSSASKLTTLSFRLLVERAEGSGFVLVYVAAASLAAGTYYITMAGVNYSFTTTQAVPAGGKIYFSSNGTTGKTTNNGATIEDLTLTAGSTGTELQGSDIVNFLTQMQANVAAIDAELDSKADKSAIEENLTAGTSLATIDKNSYTPNTSPYLYRISPSGKRCEMDIIGGTVGWNQLVDSNTTSVTIASGHKYAKYTSSAWSIGASAGSAISVDGANGDMLIDLTTLLGSTIADYAYQLEQTTTGSGIAWLKSFGFLTKSYYEYCAPTLESVQATARVARGINQWDEEIELGTISSTNGQNVSSTNGQFWRSKNYIPVISGKGYYTKQADGYTTSNANITFYYYDGDKNFIDFSNNRANGTTTIPDNVSYIRFTQFFVTPNLNIPNGICINLSNPTINGQYFPYESHTYPLGNTTLRGIPKLDSSNNIYYDGDRRKSDGSVKRKYKKLTLDGSEIWALQSINNYGIANFSTTITEYKNAANSICDKFAFQTSSIATTQTEGYLPAAGQYLYIRISSSKASTVAKFKTWLVSNPVTVVYELATPTTETTDSFTPIQYTGSTEEFSTDNDVPVGVEGKYYTDLTLPTLPTANGTYTLKCTVTDGVGIVSWVSE